MNLVLFSYKYKLKLTWSFQKFTNIIFTW